MDCPECRYTQMQVIESRHYNDGKNIRRRRQCIKCGLRVTTEENIRPDKKKKEAV